MIIVLLVALIEAAGGAVGIPKEIVEAVDLTDKHLAMSVVNDRIVLSIEEEYVEPTPLEEDEDGTEIQETTP
jgi:antitoxin component of MazEF toxin-antitoxin module